MLAALKSPWRSVRWGCSAAAPCATRRLSAPAESPRAAPKGSQAGSSSCRSAGGRRPKDSRTGLPKRPCKCSHSLAVTHCVRSRPGSESDQLASCRRMRFANDQYPPSDHTAAPVPSTPSKCACKSAAQHTAALEAAGPKPPGAAGACRNSMPSGPAVLASSRSRDSSAPPSAGVGGPNSAPSIRGTRNSSGGQAEGTRRLE